MEHCVLLKTERDQLYLVTTGLAWAGGRRTHLQLVKWLIEHVEVSLDTCHRLPATYRRFIEARR